MMLSELRARPTVALGPKVRNVATGFGRLVWDALHGLGARRARSELLRAAQIHEYSNPELAARLRKLVQDDCSTRG